MSHGHVDHIGGLVTKSGALAFSKAQFVFVDTEWNYWTAAMGKRGRQFADADPFKSATIAAAQSLPPVAGRCRFVKQGGEIRGGALCRGRDILPPMPRSVHLRQSAIIHMGDIAHNPVTSLQHPDWTPLFDYDPAQAIKSRKAILDRVATDRVMAMATISIPGDRHVADRARPTIGKPSSGL